MKKERLCIIFFEPELLGGMLVKSNSYPHRMGTCTVDISDFIEQGEMLDTDLFSMCYGENMCKTVLELLPTIDQNPRQQMPYDLWMDTIWWKRERDLKSNQGNLPD